MTQEKAKELLPIIQAIADGKEFTLQTPNGNGGWIDVPTDILDSDLLYCTYRIKPDYCEKFENDLKSQDLENKDFVYDYNNQHIKGYRPFKDCNELIEHYQKNYKSAIGCDIYFPSLYKPCIWVREKDTECDSLITEYAPYGVTLGGEINRIGLQELLDNYTFLDGSPCGVEE